MRNVCFTVFATEGEELLELDPTLWPECVSYVVWQRELCPQTLREHYQGYMELTGQKSAAQMHLWQGLETAHFEPRHGTQQQNITYCTKDESRIEGPYTHGEPKRPGSRTDILALKESIDEGTSTNQLWQDHPTTMFRMHKAATTYKRTITPKRDWAMELIIYIGPSGTGKTRTAREAYPDAYWKPKGKWWDGYDGQETVVIDEMYGSSFSFGELLQLLDRYPHSVEIKGDTVEFTSRRIVMTSNQEPEDWYDAEKTHQMDWANNPLNRRIQEFGRIIRTGEVHRRVRPRLNFADLFGEQRIDEEIIEIE